MRVALAQLPFPRIGRAIPRVPVWPILLFTMAVALLAGAIHIVTILLIPTYAVLDGWTRLAAIAGENRFAEIRQPQGGEEVVPGLDPLFLNGACALDLSQNPAALSLSAGERFWSLALYDPAGRVIFSLNDRTASAGQLQMLVVNSVQNAELRESPPPGVDQTIVVESALDDLVALLRLYAPTGAARATAADTLRSAGCRPAPGGIPEAVSGR